MASHIYNGTTRIPATPENASDGMKVLARAIYRGPHLYSHTPMIRIELDLGPLENWPSNKIIGFQDRLIELLPGLRKHGCSYGEEGGFIRRLEDGTWLGHVAEHIALELQTMAGMRVTRGKTRSVKGKAGVYNIMFEYGSEKAALWSGRYALELVNSLLPPELAGIAGLEKICGDEDPVYLNIEESVKRLRTIAGRERLGPTCRSIVEAAGKQGIPVMRLDDQSLVQLGWGKHQRRIRGSVTDATSQIAVDAAGDKELTKRLLSAAGVPVPKGDVVRTLEGALSAAREIGFPVAIKPLDGNHGRGVTTNILNDEQAKQAFEFAAKHGRYIIVEEFYAGRDYRILVVNGQVVAVSERIPAHVVGDGIHTIAQLIEKINSDPRRGEGHEEIMTKITIDQAVHDLLARSNLTLESVPEDQRKVFLRCTANMSTGGTAIDRTDYIHPDNIVLMERAARAIGLDIAGIDLITKDISLPIEAHGGGIVEINASPGFRMHLESSDGKSRPVGDAVVSMLFPKEKPSRIPIVAITGTNGKSTTTRMVTSILRQQGKRVGFTSTSGVYVNDETLWEGDASGPQSARLLFRDPTIDYAVLETARGGILREGLAFDYCDVGAVLNVTEDHIGLKGVQTVQDLADVKSVVVESVSDKGVSVLNADDPLTRDMTRHAGGRICFFSMHGGHEMSEALRAHIDQGGMAVVRENWSGREEIVIHVDQKRIPLMSVLQIPCAYGGAAHFNVQNALAAAAIAYSLNVDLETIRTGLSSFASTFKDNPGRMNIYDEHGFRVIMDYAHNPAALKALLGLVSAMSDKYNNVIGTISTPGDRRDEDIREMGRIAARGFDFLVFREGPDERGRAPGEVNRLLAEGALSEGFSKENMICVRPEEEAVDLCLRQANPGDLVILTPTDVEGIWRRVLDFKPRHALLAPEAMRAVRYHA